jgi:hypothetical protein
MYLIIQVPFLARFLGWLDDNGGRGVGMASFFKQSKQWRIEEMLSDPLGWMQYSLALGHMRRGQTSSQSAS